MGISTIALIVAAGLTYGFWPNPITVDTGKASRNSMELTIEEEGMTRVKDRYIISVPVTGTVQRIGLEVGDHVRSGTIVARVKPTAPTLLDERQLAISTARLNSAEAALQQARENLKLATEEAAYNLKEFQRIEQLHKNGIGSDRDLDRADLANRRAHANKKSAEFGVNIAEHELESARAAIRWAQRTPPSDDILEIKSPVGGYLLSIPNKSERPVLTGEALMEVGDMQSLEIRVDVLSSDAIQILPSTKVRIKRWGGDCILEGSVRVIEPAGYTKISALGVEEQRVPVIIDITSDKKAWSRLGDGYRVVAEFIIWEGTDVLQVPTSALFRIGDEWALFVLEDGKAYRRTVNVGHQSGLFAEILGGLKQGETVLTHPDERIEDGIRVESRN